MPFPHLNIYSIKYCIFYFRQIFYVVTLVLKIYLILSHHILFKVITKLLQWQEIISFPKLFENVLIRSRIDRRRWEEVISSWLLPMWPQSIPHYSVSYLNIPKLHNQLPTWPQSIPPHQILCHSTKYPTSSTTWPQNPLMRQPYLLQQITLMYRKTCRFVFMLCDTDYFNQVFETQFLNVRALGGSLKGG